MRLLLDTQALFWSFEDAEELSDRARQTITRSGNEVLVSAASIWELAIKTKLGKLDAQALLDDFATHFQDLGFQALPITAEHAVRSGALPLHHKDPFDRMLAAQAQAENLPVVSNDKIFERYGVRRIW